MCCPTESPTCLTYSVGCAMILCGTTGFSFIASSLLITLVLRSLCVSSELRGCAKNPSAMEVSRVTRMLALLSVNKASSLVGSSESWDVFRRATLKSDLACVGVGLSVLDVVGFRAKFALTAFA